MLAQAGTELGDARVEVVGQLAIGERRRIDRLERPDRGQACRPQLVEPPPEVVAPDASIERHACLAVPAAELGVQPGDQPQHGVGRRAAVRRRHAGESHGAVGEAVDVAHLDVAEHHPVSPGEAAEPVGHGVGEDSLHDGRDRPDVVRGVVRPGARSRLVPGDRAGTHSPTPLRRARSHSTRVGPRAHVGGLVDAQPPDVGERVVRGERGEQTDHAPELPVVVGIELPGQGPDRSVDPLVPLRPSRGRGTAGELRDRERLEHALVGCEEPVDLRHRPDQLGRRGRRGHAAVRRGDQGRHRRCEAVEQVLLGREVVVHGSHRHLGSRRDLRNRDGAGALFDDQVDERAEDREPCGFRVGFASGAVIRS